MALILAIEPDARQAAQITAIARHRVGAELMLAGTTEQALDVIGDRVPDLVLVPALLSPQEDAALAGALRVIAAAAHVRTLTIPVLASKTHAPAEGGMLAKWRRGKDSSPAPDGCDPAIFAEQISAYLREAAAERAALAPEVEDEADIPSAVEEAPPVLAEAVAPIEEPIAVEPEPVAIAAAPAIIEPPAIEPPVTIETPVAVETPAAIEMPAAIEPRASEPLAAAAEEALEPREPREPSEPLMSEIFAALSTVDRFNIPSERARAPKPRVKVEQPVAAPVANEPPRLELWMPLSFGDDRRWPRLEGIEAEIMDVHDEVMTALASANRAIQALPKIERPAPAKPAKKPDAPKAEKPEWSQLIASLRQDIERLRNENQPAEAAAAPRAPEPAPKAAAPATPAVPVRKPKAAGMPVQDEWGFFDPQQCGFAALLAKLNEITDETDARVH